MNTRPVVAKFAEKRYWDRPTKNFQTCVLVYGDDTQLRPTVLANVNRSRKTKRSAWVAELSLHAQIPRGTPADVLMYVQAITNAAAAVEWPIEEIKP